MRWAIRSRSDRPGSVDPNAAPLTSTWGMASGPSWSGGAGDLAERVVPVSAAAPGVIADRQPVLADHVHAGQVIGVIGAGGVDRGPGRTVPSLDQRGLRDAAAPGLPPHRPGPRRRWSPPGASRA